MKIDLDKTCRCLAIVIMLVMLGLSQANATPIPGKGFRSLDAKSVIGMQKNRLFKPSKLQTKQAAPADARGFRSLKHTTRMSKLEFSRAGYRDRSSRRWDGALYEHLDEGEVTAHEPTGDFVTDTLADLYGLAPVDKNHPFLNR